jgi:hypothetical protein
VAELPVDNSFEVVCPHCRKRFVGALISGATSRHRGFKCPHCKLFVPAERAEQPPRRT